MCPLGGAANWPQALAAGLVQAPRSDDPEDPVGWAGAPLPILSLLIQDRYALQSRPQHSGLGVSLKTYCVPHSCPHLLCCCLISAQVGPEAGEEARKLSRGLGPEQLTTWTQARHVPKCRLVPRAHAPPDFLDTATSARALHMGPRATTQGWCRWAESKAGQSTCSLWAGGEATLPLSRPSSGTAKSRAPWSSEQP